MGAPKARAGSGAASARYWRSQRGGSGEAIARHLEGG